jgi:hypothetical protein
MSTKEDSRFLPAKHAKRRERDSSFRVFFAGGINWLLLTSKNAKTKERE